MKTITLMLAFLSLITTVNAQTVFISEIMPNPEGKDKNHEWIELYNKSDKTMKLDGWQLENKKTQTINGTIPAKSYLVLENLKITLKNKEDHIRLLDNNGTLIDEVQYQNAKNNKSFSRIKISKEPLKNDGMQGNEELTTELYEAVQRGESNEVDATLRIFQRFHGQYLWQWGEPTKNAPNPEVHKISINSAELPLAYFNEKNAALLKLITNKNRSLQLLVEKNSDNLKIHDIKIENPLTTKLKTWSETWVYYFLIASLWLLFLIRASLKATPLYASPHK